VRYEPTVLCDLDGVIWLAGAPIPGAVEAVGRIREAGGRVLFVTNNSRPRRVEHERVLEGIGIERPEVLTSSMACSALLDDGERVLLCGGPGLREAAEAAGAVVTPVEDVTEDAVVAGGSAAFSAVLVGITTAFDYRLLSIMTRAIRGGARLVGANEDRVYPTPSGPLPGGGSLVAAVAHAGGVVPTVAGKPHEAMAQLVERTVGGARPLHDVWMFGDQDATDGRFAERLGCRYARIGAGIDPADIEAPTFARAVDILLDQGWPAEG
jgi:HAD superfamily hydrolase (TIGR01450 family)